MVQLVISSKDRIPGTPGFTDSHFTVPVNRDTPIRAAKLNSVYVPAIYNVETFNGTLTWTETAGPTTLTATLAPGMYNVTDFTTGASGLAAAMTAASAAGPNAWTYTVVYSSITGLVTITETGANTFTIDSASSTITDLLGTFATGPAAASFVSTTVLDLAFPKCLYLYIHELGIHVNSSQAKRGATYVVDLPFTTKEAYNITFLRDLYPRDATINNGSPKQLATMEVEVTYPDGRPVDFRGQEFKFMLDICPCAGPARAFCCRKC